MTISRGNDVVQRKSDLRARLLAARPGAGDVAARDARLMRHAAGWVRGVAAARGSASSRDDAPIVVAAHVPAGSEPGAAADLPAALLGALDDAAGGGGAPGAEPRVRLLLPVCPPGPPAALRWGWFTGSLRPGRFGLPEPDGEVLGPEALGLADAIVLPGVAADRRGMRMGRGAGYYDRSLEFARPDAPTAVLLHPGEVVDEVPADAHDRPVGALITCDGVEPIGG
ncbi:5-formyltetrahydrofolate cyclo-ligase [Corynebacterium sp. 335C]